MSVDYLNPVDAERLRAFSETDDLVVRNSKQIAAAVIKGAKEGDRTCREIFYKYLHNPIRQELDTKQAELREPPSLRIRLELFNMSARQGQPQPIQLSASDMKQLSDEQRNLIGNNFILVGDTLTHVASTAPLLPASATPPNPQAGNGGEGAILPSKGTRTFTCSVCGAESRCDTRAHNKARCDQCTRKIKAEYQKSYKLRKHVAQQVGSVEV